VLSHPRVHLHSFACRCPGCRVRRMHDRSWPQRALPEPHHACRNRARRAPDFPGRGL